MRWTRKRVAGVVVAAVAAAGSWMGLEYARADGSGGRTLTVTLSSDPSQSVDPTNPTIPFLHVVARSPAPVDASSVMTVSVAGVPVLSSSGSSWADPQVPDHPNDDPLGSDEELRLGIDHRFPPGTQFDITVQWFDALGTPTWGTSTSYVLP